MSVLTADALDYELPDGLEELRQVAKAGVLDAPVGAPSDHQPDLVALEPPRLGRAVRLELGGKLEARYGGPQAGAPWSSATR